MDLEELKLYMKVDGNELDTIILGYQLAAEQYLLNAGVTVGYENNLYKVLISILAITFLENPSLVATTGKTSSLSLTLDCIIAQLRLC